HIGAGLAIRDGARLEHEPAPRPVRVNELQEKPRLPPPRLADDGDALPLSPSRFVEGLAKMVELLAAPHEPREPPCRRRLKARARRRWSAELEYVDWARQPLDRNRTDRDDFDEPLGEPERLGGQPPRARCRELLHARGEVGGLAPRRIVHAQIPPDGAPHHLAAV